MNNVEGYWHRRKLPHFEGGDIPQGVTFRLADSLPREKLAILKEQEVRLGGQAAAAERRRLVNQWLDEGYGSAWLRMPAVAAIVQGALRYFDGQRYVLHAWCIMPNHVHVICTPCEPWTISKILHSWKSFSAREANKLLNRTGVFWQEEYFDRAIRDEQHLHAAIAYVEQNPVKAGLCQTSQEWTYGSASLAGN